MWLCPVFLTAQPLLVLDSGHTPKNGGSISVNGQYEVQYNDRFVSELKPALEASGWKVLLTRKADEEIDLTQRAAIANRMNADLFLSIHHDSAQLKYLKPIEIQGKPAYQSKHAIEGYSLFVSAENPYFKQSQNLASKLGKKLQKLGRAPALHHTEPIEGENRTLLNKQYGVYRYDGLMVLRQTKMPAILLEIGVIIDSKDEAYINDKTNRQLMIEQIVDTLRPSNLF